MTTYPTTTARRTQLEVARRAEHIAAIFEVERMRARVLRLFGRAA